MNAFNQQEITMISTPRKCNTLSNADSYKLTRWIELNQASLKGKTQELVALEAGQATGLKVTIPNIHAVAKTLGIALGLYSVKKGEAPTAIERSLALALCDLYGRLGESVPVDVNAIAGRDAS